MPLWRKFRRALDVAAGLLPQDCVLCAARAGPDGLCDGCRGDLPRLPAAHCPSCALPTPAAAVCGRCLRAAPAFDAVAAGLVYTFPVDRMIQRLKFNAALTLVPVLTQPLLAAIAQHASPDLIVPMPLAASRLRARGFNQAVEIARRLARFSNRNLAVDLCQRVRDTPHQTGLSLAARRANLKDAFRCGELPPGAHVAVVDDVMTSGASMDELARTLKRAGAARVVGWVVARTPGDVTANVARSSAARRQSAD